MSYGTRSWARLTFSPSTGETTVDGDLFAVLGINNEEVIRSDDPFSMLPDSVARGLMEGEGIVRDDDLSLVILSGKSGHCNTVTVIAEHISDYDLISDLAGGVVSFSPDGEILSWNRRMTYLFGPREKDVKGRKAADILPEPVLYNWDSVISSAHLGHEVKVEFRPSGEKRVEGVLSRGGPGVIGLFRDSTETYKTGKRLRALNRLNQAYLQSTGTGLLLLDSRLRILLSNKGFSAVTGHKGAIMGLQLHDVLPVESYKWVHDASEHLFTEERAELSAVLSFENQNGKHVTLRQTLRAVRNETNQAVNFVCLFEDETDITFFREEMDHAKKSIAGLSRMSDGLLKSGSAVSDTVCEDVLRITRSKAVARYVYDAYATLRLSGCAGEWPQGSPFQEPVEFDFPAFVWTGDKIYNISYGKIGKLSDHFRCCTVLPVGEGVANKGYLVLAEMENSDPELLKTVSSLAGIQLEILDARATRLSNENHPNLGEGIADAYLDCIQLPLAIVHMDGRIEHWNPAMEEVCGVATEEAGSYDLSNLIDPDNAGYTLDSLCSVSNYTEYDHSTEWAVSRPDGSSSGVFRWKVSIIESTPGVYRDPDFLVSGIPSGSWSSGNDMQCGKVLEDIRKLLSLLSSSAAPNELYGCVSRVCFGLCGKGIMEFSSGDEPVAVFSEGMEAGGDTHWAGEVSALLGKKEFQMKYAGNLNRKTINSVLALLSCTSADVESSEIQDFSSELTSYLQKFSADSIEQNNAILHIVDKTDPLASFARTMLFSNQTAAKVVHLLKLSVMVRQNSLEAVRPDRFLPGLHSIFSRKGLRPPSLSFSDKMPPVLIIPEVVLQCLDMLCELLVLAGVASFTADSSYSSDSVDEDGAVVSLTLRGLSEPLHEISREESTRRLQDGVFDSEVETFTILSLLNQSGCSPVSSEGKEIVFLLGSKG